MIENGAFKTDWVAFNTKLDDPADISLIIEFSCIVRKKQELTNQVASLEKTLEKKDLVQWRHIKEFGLGFGQVQLFMMPSPTGM